MTTLTGGPGPVELTPGGVRLHAPGVLGEARPVGAGPADVADPSDLAWLEAIENAGLQSSQAFEIQVMAQVLAPAPAGPLRQRIGLPASQPDVGRGMRVSVPAGREGTEYALLYTDSAGISHWVFAESGPAAPALSGEVVFRLPSSGAQPPGGAGRAPLAPAARPAVSARMPLSVRQLGSHLVRVLSWSATDAAGAGALETAAVWETQHRPYGFHLVEPEPYTRPVPIATPVDWDLLRQGRALLLLHGTFSTAQASFAQLGRETLQALSDFYHGRVFAFNHPSLHHSPRQNLQALFDGLPAGLELDVDVMTHSRGGLVGRELAERQALVNSAGRQVRIHKAIFVAGPNQGTVLTDPENDVELLDRYTNALARLPRSAATDSMAGLLVLVKLVGHGALAQLPGLRCLQPRGDYVAGLNAGALAAAGYYALAANYTPSDPALLARLGQRVRDQFIDSLFRVDNDMVVPTLGCYSAAPAFLIPPERRRVYTGAAQVNHVNFFSTPIVREQILAWLTEPDV